MPVRTHYNWYKNTLCSSLTIDAGQSIEILPQVGQPTVLVNGSLLTHTPAVQGPSNSCPTVSLQTAEHGGTSQHAVAGYPMSWDLYALSLVVYIVDSSDCKQFVTYIQLVVVSYIHPVV